MYFITGSLNFKYVCNVLPIILLFRYLGNEQQYENNEDTTTKNLHVLLSKVKHRIKQKCSNTSVDESVGRNLTAPTNNLPQKKGKKKRIKDDNLSESKKIKRDDGDCTNNLIADVQRLNVNDDERDDSTNNVLKFADEDVNSVKNGAFPIIGDFKFKKKTKVCVLTY